MAKFYGKLVAVLRCDACPNSGPRITDDSSFCNRYRKMCPPNGIPSWCRLRNAPRPKKRPRPVELIKMEL